MSYRRKNTNKSSGKDRLLPVHTGCAGDTLYFASSSAATVGNLESLKPESYAMSQYLYGKGMRATPVGNLPGGYGYECIRTSKTGGKFNNVTHVKREYVNVPFMLAWRDYSYANGWYMVPYRRRPPQANVSLSNLVNQMHSYNSVGSDSEFSSSAFWSMRPKFEGQVSIINSIFELKDFKDVVNLPKMFRGISKALHTPNVTWAQKQRFLDTHDKRAAGVPSYWNKSEGSLKKIVEDSASTSAAAVLTVNLAIKPTLSDIMAIAAQAATAADQAQRTFQYYGAVGTTGHFGRSDTKASFTYGTKSNYVYANGLQTVLKRTATMYSHYDYVMRSHNEALRYYWGLTGTVEALWNMLPLSFVLDYVFTIGKALKYMARDNNVTKLSTEYCESCKITITQGDHIIQDPRVLSAVVDGVFIKPPTSGSRSALLVSGSRETRYTREVMEPYKGPALPRLKMPSTTQAVNMLALARLFLQ